MFWSMWIATYSTCVHMGFIQVFQLIPTSQKYVNEYVVPWDEPASFPGCIPTSLQGAWERLGIHHNPDQDELHIKNEFSNNYFTLFCFFRNNLPKISSKQLAARVCLWWIYYLHTVGTLRTGSDALWDNPNAWLLPLRSKVTLMITQSSQRNASTFSFTARKSNVFSISIPKSKSHLSLRTASQFFHSLLKYQQCDLIR